MFSKLFGRTPAPEATHDASVEAFDLFDKPRENPGRFVIPDWACVEESIAARLKTEDPHTLWANVSLHWMHALREPLGAEFRVASADNFHLLSPGTAREQQVFLEFAEKTRERILRLLDGIANDDGYGKFCVIAFADEDQYYEYVANYYPDEGEFAFSSGMYINDGYGHFVCVRTDMHAIEPVIAHELTHMLVTHLPIPAWLNEGLAVNTEHILCPPRGSLYTPRELAEMHAGFWNEETIQEFWSGKSFMRADDGNLLSYDLAKQMVTLLSQDRAQFVAFVNEANMNDSGQTSASQHLGNSLEAVIEFVVGAGKWRPEPDRWAGEVERGGFCVSR
jgi:hypothetical protein